MILGYTLLALGLAATILAAGLFIWAARLENKGKTGPLSAARRMAVTSCLFVVAASAYLSYLIVTHQFQYTYVAEYSARWSPAPYLFAAFWGGQEGSILLWTLWTSLLGALLAFKAGDREARVWPIFALVQCTLLALVLVKCPFRLGTGPVPTDGQGLNPLLENLWMVIHPPVLFLGFASLAISWVWAVYGLIYKDWDGWLERAFPWALFAFAIHGLGVALGGYWAYETLGWGGFWGWDPVENSSLVPWLFLIGLLHGAAIQRANGGFRIGNFLLASLPFALMSYGTFLTRTGVLADFSVHSFTSIGKAGYNVLLGEVIVSLVIPVGLLAIRHLSIPRQTDQTRGSSRESGLFLGTVVLGLMGLITAVGMSAPLITKFWIAKGAAAQPDFYNQALNPLAILMLLLMGAAPFCTWQLSKQSDMAKRLLPGIGGAVALTALFVAMGARNPGMILLFAVSAFAVIGNIVPIVRAAGRRESRMSVGHYVAHVGAAMLLAGIACLGVFSKQAMHISLTKDQPVQALGYKLTYLGMTSQPYDRENALRIKVEKDGQSWEANPHLFVAPMGGSEQLFANPPDVRSFIWGDLYTAHYRGPSSGSPDCPNDGMTLHRGAIMSYGDYQFIYHGLKWSDDVAQAMENGTSLDKLPEMRIHALIDVIYHGQTYPISPVLVFDQANSSKYSIPAALPGTPNAIIVLNDVKLPFDATVSTSNLPDPTEMVQVDLSTKPMIWLVWLGTILYTLGGLMAYRYRARRFRQHVAPPPPPLDIAPSTEPASTEPETAGVS